MPARITVSTVAAVRGPRSITNRSGMGIITVRILVEAVPLSLLGDRLPLPARYFSPDWVAVPIFLRKECRGALAASCPG